MRAGSLFAHPELAQLRTVLGGSPTARSVMDAIADLPTRVRFIDPPANASPAEIARVNDWCFYSGARNRVAIPRSFVTPRPAGQAPSKHDIEDAALVLHEARHRQQYGRFPLLRTLGSSLEPARALVAGLRELRPASTGEGRGALRRFVDGFDASTMRDEIDAYQVQLRSMRELLPGRDAGEEAPLRILATLRDERSYLHRIWAARATAGAGVIGAGVGATQLVRGSMD